MFPDVQVLLLNVTLEVEAKKSHLHVIIAVFQREIFLNVVRVLCVCVLVFFFVFKPVCVSQSSFLYLLFIHGFSNAYQVCSEHFLDTTEMFSCFKTLWHSSFLHDFKLHKFYIPFQNFQYAPSVIIPINCQSINISWNKMNNKAI